MELTPLQQIIKLISQKERILLITHVRPDGDAVSSVLALLLILEKMGKTNALAVSADPIPEMFEFLPSNERMQQKTVFNQDFIITLDLGSVSVDKLRWSTVGEKLNITITPKNGSLSEKNVNFSNKEANFDLIIALDAADKEQLGRIFSENTEVFAEVPLINIDHHISNTDFGTINYIDSSACSTTEVLYSLLPEFEKHASKKLLDENIATLLLTGIITDTGSFQNPNVTPKSFEVAADLIEAGARQQEIIRRLFKTKNLSTLKLWGRVLSKIKNDPIHRFVWSTVSKEDLEESGATSHELVGILDDLLSNAPGAEVVLLLKEREDGIVAGSLRTTSNAIDATEIAKSFGGGGHKQAAGFKIPKAHRSFEIIAEEVIAKIRQFQARRLGISSNNQPEVIAKNLPLSQSTQSYSTSNTQAIDISEILQKNLNTKKDLSGVIDIFEKARESVNMRPEDK
jgi:phosphoesterase RecJ-like protein